MKNLLRILLVVFISSSCNKPNKAIKERIAHSDSVAINYFKGDGTMDTVLAVKITSDRQIIEQLATFIGERSVKGKAACGYDGSMHFFKMNQVIQDIDFSMNADSCMYFSFAQFGKKQSTVLSPAAKELITALRKK